MHAATHLKALLKQPGIIQVAGAYDALSAKLAQEAGFDGVWAGGFSISASLKCIPDASFVTLTEQIAVERNMAEAISIPIIADCDTGYGNALNVMRTVNDHERAGIAGICIEDNVFPKRCSFYAGVRRELVSIEEHCGKIKAAKSAQMVPDFMVIARTEALIAGWGKDEALSRIQAYTDAGADAILIHSKEKTFDELRDVAQACSKKIPLVAVPTTYASVSLEELETAGFKMVIYANQSIRAAIWAMREALEKLKQSGRADTVDQQIVPLQEVYDLVGVTKMKEDEQRFLPPGGEPITAIIAAAGFEKHLLPLTQKRPKCLLDIKGKTILERQIAALNECGIKDISLIRGYQKTAINMPHIRFYDNDQFEKTGDLFSFFCAEQEMNGRSLFLYGDIIFDTAVLQKLLKSPADLAIIVDLAWLDRPLEDFPNAKVRSDLVLLESPPGKSYRYVTPDEANRVIKIGRDLPHEQAHGEFIGLMMASSQGVQTLKQIYHELQKRGVHQGVHESPSLEQASLTDMLQELIESGQEVQAICTYKGWMDIDSFEDYQKAWAEIS